MVPFVKEDIDARNRQKRDGKNMVLLGAQLMKTNC